MPIAKKLPSGSWRCRVYIGETDGKPVYKSITAATKKSAELQAIEYARTHKSSDSTDATFSEYAKLHIDNRSNILSPASVRKYKNTLKSLNENYDWFTDKKAMKITKSDVQKLVNEMALDYAPKSVKTTFGFINTCLKDYTSLNGVILPRIEPTEVVIPTDAEIKRLLEVSKGTAMEVPILLGSQCMMRRAEISALTLDDVNFEKNEITINKAMVMDDDGKWVVKAPKTIYSNRTIPVRKEVIDVIKEKGTITNLNPNKITRFFEDYCRKANVPDYHFHCLRHYACSVFALSCPMSYLKFYGGWGESKTVEKIYLHIKSEQKDDIFKQAFQHFENI